MHRCFRVSVIALLVLLAIGGLSAQTARHSVTAQGVISGTVTDDSSGLPLKEALVRFFNPHGFWIQGVHTDTAGAYAAHLDTGKYLVRIDKFGYFPEWFDDAQEVRNAYVADLHADTTLTADVGLRPIERPVFVTVSGTVTDSATGLPLPNTVVAFLRPHRDLRLLELLSNLFGGPPQERWHIPGFGWLNGVVWAGLTDGSGNYEAHLLRNEPTIAIAFHPGYLPEFYNNKISPFDADRLIFNGNAGGVSFDLLQNPVAVNSLAGTVVDSSGAGVQAHVMLVRLLPNGAPLVRYQATDSVGNYQFQHLAAGRFLVKAIPVDGFAPAWHADAACGVRNWHNADPVNLTSSVSGVDICVRPARCNGFGRIAGLIHPGGVTLSSLATEGGATVYAVSNESNEIAGYDVTENDGSYSIDNLLPGSYTVVVDKEGFIAGSAPVVTLDANNGYQEPASNIPINADPVLSVPIGSQGTPKAFSLHQNYPNPFNPNTTIRFDVPVPSIVVVKIYNLIGQKVAQLADGLTQPGAYSVDWNGSSDNGVQLTSGIYFVKMVAAPVDGDRPEFNALRKMIMVK